VKNLVDGLENAIVNELNDDTDLTSELGQSIKDSGDE
jgi:hypothetical protein